MTGAFAAPPMSHANHASFPTSDAATVGTPKMPPPMHVLITSATRLQRPMARNSPRDSSWLGCVETPMLIREASARENLDVESNGIVSQNDALSGLSEYDWQVRKYKGRK